MVGLIFKALKKINLFLCTQCIEANNHNVLLLWDHCLTSVDPLAHEYFLEFIATIYFLDYLCINLLFLFFFSKSKNND